MLSKLLIRHIFVLTNLRKGRVYSLLELRRWSWLSHSLWRWHVGRRRSHSILMSKWRWHHSLRWYWHRWWPSHWRWSSHWWHTWCTHADSSSWSSKSAWSLMHHRCYLHWPRHWLCSSHSTHCCSFSYSSASLGRWCLSTHRYNVISSEKNET